MKTTKTHPASRQMITGVLVSALVLLVSGCGEEAEEFGEYHVEGPLTVSYGVQISETTRTNQTGTFSELQVLDGFVVLVSEDGLGGEVVPLSKLNNLAWRKN